MAGVQQESLETIISISLLSNQIRKSGKTKEPFDQEVNYNFLGRSICLQLPFESHCLYGHA